MTREKVKATTSGVLAAATLGGLIVLGSRNLAHFDAALVGYTFATLFATFGIAYRYAMWLQRPPTAVVLAARLAALLPAPLPRPQPRRARPALGRRLRAEPVHLAARCHPRGAPTG